MEPLLEGLLRSSGGSEANFLEVCFGRIPSGNFHTEATSKKSGPPSGNFRQNPPELPRSPSRSFSSHEAGRKAILFVNPRSTIRHENITYPKKSFSNYFPITVSRFRFLRINFRKLPDTYCICVSCVTLPGWDPCPCRIIFFTVTRFEFFRINWVMFSWQMVNTEVMQMVLRSTSTSSSSPWKMQTFELGKLRWIA